VSFSVIADAIASVTVSTSSSSSVEKLPKDLVSLLPPAGENVCYKSQQISTRPLGFKLTSVL
jgi:hypothetical protein